LFSSAGLAHLVEQLICNHQVVGSSPAAGTNKKQTTPFVVSTPGVVLFVHATIKVNHSG
jgi:hypothetical protein